MCIRNFSIPSLFAALFLVTACNDNGQSQKAEALESPTGAVTLSEVSDADYGYDLDYYHSDYYYYHYYYHYSDSYSCSLSDSYADS